MLSYFLPNIFNTVEIKSLMLGVFLFSCTIILLLGNKIIVLIKKIQKQGQPISKYSPRLHANKQGTPTMGGVLLIATFLFVVILTANINNTYIIELLTLIIAFAILGMVDDLTKIKQSKNSGSRAKYKFIYQIIISIIFVFYLQYNHDIDSNIIFFIPFYDNINLNIGVLYLPFATIVISGAANSVNITDGLDGLALGITSIILCAFLFIINNQDISMIIVALLGSCVGLLWFNSYKAKIFIGDTGSLALGAALGGIAVITKHEISLFIMGGVLVFETLSVILQIGRLKLTGKRFFLMAPFHHHLEQKNIHEANIIIKFWIITILLSVIGIFITT